MANSCLLDTGPMVALFDASDQYHKKSVDFIRSYKGELITSTANITETIYLLDFSTQAQLDFLQWIRKGAVTLEPIDNADINHIFEHFSNYSNVPMDFADGCLVAIAEKLGVSKIATFDSDFNIYKLFRNKHFEMMIER
jgi:predicted nucleic acid-binding protein